MRRENGLGSSQPLLPVHSGGPVALFQCPGCRRRLQSPVTPPPAWLRCVHCRTRFIANQAKAKLFFLFYLVLGNACLAAGIYLNLSTTHPFFITLIVFGGLCALRAVVGLCLLRRQESAHLTVGTATGTADPAPLNPAFVAAKSGDLDGMQRAMQSGFAVNSSSPEGISCLQYAAQGGHVEVVDFLLARGADPNIRSTGSCPFLEAAACGHVEVLKLLLQVGAQEFVTTTPRQGQVQVNALTLACVRGHPHVAAFLLERGHDPNFSTPGCHPPLLCAAKEGFIDIVELLCCYRADLNRQNSQQMTALHVAVVHNRAGVIRALLENGALKTILDRNGLTPRELARRRNRPNLVALFDTVEPALFEDAPPTYEESVEHVPGEAAAAATSQPAADAAPP
eukprot:m.143887 g.143887  ORF g.143887 m.143887 type:complete len:396 (+) comp17176_c0_seq2:497-1684(+)